MKTTNSRGCSAKVSNATRKSAYRHSDNKPNPVNLTTHPKLQMDGQDTVTIAALLDELTMFLKEVINLRDLIRVSGSEVELHDRLLTIAEWKLQEIVQIMKRYVPPA